MKNNVLERMLQDRNKVTEKPPIGEDVAVESLSKDEANVIERLFEKDVLEHVSDRAFGKQLRGLSDKDRTVIETDTDLLIESMHLHHPGERYSFDNVASDVINITITNTTIDDVELRFIGRNVSLRIENSFILSSRMDFWQHSYPIIIYNCTVSKNTSKLYNLLSFVNSVVQFLNCTFIGQNTIDCHSGNVTMTTTTIKGNMRNFLKTEKCNVAIRSSYFIDNTDLRLTPIGSNGWISNCVFSNNSWAILNVEQGKLIIGNSQFLNNTNQDGEIITVREGCVGDIINSTFTGNEAMAGTALRIHHRSHVTTSGCWFLGNIAKGKGGAIYVSYRSKYLDYGNVFADNYAGVAGIS